ncbi:MAG: hypothetical protein GQF41_1538 [Candidatus Rifleibacterium amylolyticum]|nr:MAG: hypothetical protein GQF41_1538 [Candidatus Rifleibacterium amylolyticum]
MASGVLLTIFCLSADCLKSSTRMPPESSQNLGYNQVAKTSFFDIS